MLKTFFKRRHQLDLGRCSEALSAQISTKGFTQSFNFVLSEVSTWLSASQLRSAASVFLAVLCVSALAGCNGTSKPTSTMSRPDGPDADVVRAQDAHEYKVEVTVCAPVVKLLSDDTEGLPHERFLIELSNGTTVLIAHDTKMAPRVPLAVGDRPVIHGEYIWNNKGGVIHWTHHSDSERHESGFIMLNGKRYQ